jgi:hypothetical protein
VLESLEPRLLLNGVVFGNPAGGSWSDPANWQGGVLPGAGDSVTIAGLNPGATVTFDGAPTPVVNLTVAGGTLEIDAGTLEVTGNVNVQAGSGSGESQVPPGTLSIAGGTFKVDGGATVANQGIINTIAAGSPSVLDNQGVITNSGTITIA